MRVLVLLFILFLSQNILAQNHAPPSCSCACVRARDTTRTLYGACFQVYFGPDATCPADPLAIDRIAPNDASFPYATDLDGRDSNSCPTVACGIPADECTALRQNPKASIEPMTSLVPPSVPCHLLPFDQSEYPISRRTLTMGDLWVRRSNNDPALTFVNAEDHRGPRSSWRRYWVAYRPRWRGERYNSAMFGNSPPPRVYDSPRNYRGPVSVDHDEGARVYWQQCELQGVYPADVDIDSSLFGPQRIYNQWSAVRQVESDVANVLWWWGREGVMGYLPLYASAFAIRECIDHTQTLRCWTNAVAQVGSDLVFFPMLAAPIAAMTTPVRAALAGGNAILGVMRMAQATDAVNRGEGWEAIMYSAAALLHAVDGAMITSMPPYVRRPPNQVTVSVENHANCATCRLESGGGVSTGPALNLTQPIVQNSIARRVTDLTNILIAGMPELSAAERAIVRQQLTQRLPQVLQLIDELKDLLRNNPFAFLERVRGLTRSPVTGGDRWCIINRLRVNTVGDSFSGELNNFQLIRNTRTFNSDQLPGLVNPNGQWLNTLIHDDINFVNRYFHEENLSAFVDIYIREGSATPRLIGRSSTALPGEVDVARTLARLWFEEIVHGLGNNILQPATGGTRRYIALAERTVRFRDWLRNQTSESLLGIFTPPRQNYLLVPGGYRNFLLMELEEADIVELVLQAGVPFGQPNESSYAIRNIFDWWIRNGSPLR